MTGTPLVVVDRSGGGGATSFLGRPFPTYPDPQFLGQRTTGRLLVDRNPLYHNLVDTSLNGTGTHSTRYFHAFDDSVKPFKIGWQEKRHPWNIPSRRPTEEQHAFEREHYNEGSRRLRAESVSRSENRNNFNPIQHTTRRGGRESVDAEPWQHERVHFHPTAPPSPRLQQERYQRSMAILALRTERLALEGRPEAKRAQNNMADTMRWHYPQPSSPAIDASPLRSSFVGKSFAWREHDEAQCRPQDPARFNRAQFSNNVKECLAWNLDKPAAKPAQ